MWGNKNENINCEEGSFVSPFYKREGTWTSFILQWLVGLLQGTKQETRSYLVPSNDAMIIRFHMIINQEHNTKSLARNRRLTAKSGISRTNNNQTPLLLKITAIACKFERNCRQLSIEVNVIHISALHLTLITLDRFRFLKWKYLINSIISHRYTNFFHFRCYCCILLWLLF